MLTLNQFKAAAAAQSRLESHTDTGDPVLNNLQARGLAEVALRLSLTTRDTPVAVAPCDNPLDPAFYGSPSSTVYLRAVARAVHDAQVKMAVERATKTL